MKSKLNLPAVCMLMLTIFFACNNTKEKEQKFELNGTLEGITDGKIVLGYSSDSGYIRDTAVITGGKFVFKGDFPNPTEAGLFSVDSWLFTRKIYIENARMNFTGVARKYKRKNLFKREGAPEYIISVEDVKVTGGKVQEEFNYYCRLRENISNKYSDARKEYHLISTTKERKAELKKKFEKQKKEYEALEEKFIKENPLSHYAAVLVTGQLRQKSAAEIEKVLNSLDPRLQEHYLLVNLKSEAAEMTKVEIGIDKIMPAASNVSYEVDKKFEEEGLNDVIYLGAFTNDNICALLKDGTVRIFSPNGKTVRSFKPELKGAPSSVAVDKSDNIYVLSVLQKKVSKKIRGKFRDEITSLGVECTVFNKNGEQINHYSLPGSKTAKGARVSGDKLIVSDYENTRIAMFDKRTGKAGVSIENMRACCQILDFSINEKEKILLVADVGAFRVQGFDFTGKKIIAFGQRGQSLDDFHGCCNPVSVANLSNGAVVTVEKDPTRIKVYSKEGAKKIVGIEELVKGCKHIPMIVDSKDNLYLASKEKGIVKCVSVN